MNPQLKKGLLEACVLRTLLENPSYGYKIISDTAEYIDISESTLYPILKRLEEAGYLETYKEEHSGRLRKYYKITTKGKKKMKEFKVEYNSFKKIYDYILRSNNDE